MSKIQLPENAARPLKPGEKYEPILKPQNSYPEITPYSVIMGVIMAVIFSAAAAYLGLKVGQVFEAAIPIAIIAVGLSSAMKRKNAIGENVIIQSIGASSGVIVAGAIFLSANISYKRNTANIHSLRLRLLPKSSSLAKAVATKPNPSFGPLESEVCTILQSLLSASGPSNSPPA